MTPENEPTGSATHLAKRAAAAALAISLVGALGCGAYDRMESDPPGAPTAVVVVTVADEGGRPLPDATVTVGGGAAFVDSLGRAELVLERPDVAVVAAPGHLDEPVAVAPRDGAVSVELWSRTDERGGSRVSMTFGGDVMLGRRYLDPDRSTPFIDGADSARKIVTDIAPLSATSDATIVNLETVVGELPVEQSLPAKRFLLQSSPFVVETLDEMGVDVVTLGNNHAYDWGDDGVRSTIEALDDAGIEHVGAGQTDADATRGRIVDVEGMSLGLVSMTTVNGDYVNDQLPSPDEDPPADLAPEDDWQYQQRLFSLRAPVDGDRSIDDIRVAPRPIRISEAWNVVEEAERRFADGEATDVWVAAADAFPELQDWVARRGHGGAAQWRQSAMEREVKRLRTAGADFVVVQIHGGYQFADVGSSFIQQASRTAIDAGADAVISHHPHVLQGAEWYRGKLIAYSLGNLVFDQDFLATFPSALLRVVTDGDEVLDVRFLPLVLDRYRPTPLTGNSAQRVIRTIDARSALAGSSERVVGPRVGTVLDARRTDDDGRPPDSEPAVVRFERNSGVVGLGRAESSVSIDLDPDGSAPLPPCTLVRTDLLDDDVQIGVDLFGWGHVDRDTTDQRRNSPVNLLVPADPGRWSTSSATDDDPFDLALGLHSDPNAPVTTRLLALADVDDHRLFDDAGAPLDAPADYEIRLRAHRERGERPVLELAVFDFDDSDPTVEPTTERVDGVEIALDLPDDGEWHRLTVPVPGRLSNREGPAFNAAGIRIEMPPALVAHLTIDELALIEWRGATESDAAVWGPADMVRSTSADAVELVVSGC
ncbi:MAG: CapA family protein [Ilumatobacter sp.]